MSKYSGSEISINDLDAMQILSNNDIFNKENVSLDELVSEVAKICIGEYGNNNMDSCIDELLICLEELLERDKIPLVQMDRVKKIWKVTTKNKSLIKKHGSFPSSIASKYFNSGMYGEAFDFSSNALNCLKSILGKNNRWTLRLKYWVGRTLEVLGKYSESLRMLTKIYKKEKKLFGGDDPHCLGTALGIAIAHYRIKDHRKAMKWFENTLEKRERIYGKENPDTFKIKNYIANIRSAKGEHVEAMKMLTEVLQINKRVLGEEHPDTLTTKHDMACVRYDQKEYEDALNIFKDVLQGREKVLGPDHSITLDTKTFISLTLNYLGRTEEAFMLAMQVREQKKRSTS